jgi:hypothetical protein
MVAVRMHLGISTAVVFVRVYCHCVLAEHLLYILLKSPHEKLPNTNSYLESFPPFNKNFTLQFFIIVQGKNRELVIARTWDFTSNC